MVTVFAFLAAAGAAALGRAALGRRLNKAYPWGTFTVNVSGSFVLALVAHRSAFVATVVGAGLLGTWTTFSSFARDAAALWEGAHRTAALVYVVSTVIACVGVAWVGLEVV